MRKLAAIVLCILLAVCLCACQNGQNAPTADVTENTEPTFPVFTDGMVFRFPEGTVLFGQDLSGLLGNQAYSLLEEAVENYTLKVTVNDSISRVNAKDISLQFDRAMMTQYIDTLKSGQNPAAYMPVSYNPNQLNFAIASDVTVLPQDVTLSYNADSDEYEFVAPVKGVGFNIASAMDQLDAAIMNGENSCAITVSTAAVDAAVTEESDYAQQQLKFANNAARNSLTYSYTPDGSRSTYETLGVDQMGSFICYDSQMKPYVDEEAVYAYAKQMHEIFSVGGNDGKFLTSQGEYIDFDITYADQLVDTDALAEDIIYCIENGITGERVAPYFPAEKEGYIHDFGGNYVEVDLTRQCVYGYNNYECIMWSPIVSGCLAEGWGTPNGAYDVVYKEIGATLMGLDVTFWMPFSGNYGLHDAPWRLVFDEDEYLFNGSHGCVNMPYAAAKAVFNNVVWDTPVIVHGGAHYGYTVEQELLGTDEYHVGTNGEPFTLDTTPKYGPANRLTYSSDNTEVATVSQKGVVTVVGTGTATITVESADWDFCPAVKKDITIHVHDSCSEQGHMVVTWNTASKAGCSVTGSEIGYCTACGYALYRNIPETHALDDDWEVVTEATCNKTGLEETYCELCGKTETQEIPATGHMFCNWTVVNETPTQEGKMTASCYFCGLAYEVKLSEN